MRKPLRPEELFDAALALRERAEKAEGEVERLNKQLNHIVENPHEYDVKSVFEPPFVEELQSEIKMLTKKLTITEDELADAREWLNERYKATSEADERAEKAEAELNLMQTAGIIEVAARNPSVKDFMEHWTERAEKAEAEVERLEGLVMDAARKGDELLEPYRLRAEKAETLLKQIHSFVEAINKTNK